MKLKKTEYSRELSLNKMIILRCSIDCIEGFDIDRALCLSKMFAANLQLVATFTIVGHSMYW